MPRACIMSNILYSYSMKSLGQLLGSAARTDVLRVLNCQPEAVGLRHVARIAGVHPRSAELALAGLVREHLVMRKRTGSRVLYSMNRGHPDTPILESVFEAAAQEAIRQRRPTLQIQAGTILPFIRQATRMLAIARKNRHVT